MLDGFKPQCGDVWEFSDGQQWHILKGIMGDLWAYQSENHFHVPVDSLGDNRHLVFRGGTRTCVVDGEDAVTVPCAVMLDREDGTVYVQGDTTKSADRSADDWEDSYGGRYITNFTVAVPKRIFPVPALPTVMAR